MSTIVTEIKEYVIEIQSSGATGPQGAAGVGVPTGGTTGQVLAKNSNTDYDTEWVDQTGGGGGATDHGALTGLADDDHTQYHTDARGDARYEAKNTNIQSHISSTSNPHSVTATQVGLGNVDNTSDANKPISSATQTALDGKVDENAPIAGATKTKITYDTKGLVTSGDDATTADIADSSNKRYVTDAQLIVIGNTSGSNTGDQDLSGYELLSNKSTDGTLAANSSTLYPSQSAVKTYADTKQLALGFTPENVANKENTTLDTSSTKYPTNNLVKTNVDLKANKAGDTFTGAGDSATYNGADDSVKLTLRSNAAAGSSYDSDIVAASSTAASNGAWETLSYTLPSNVTDDTALEFWIECVGTGGFVNFDTIAVT